MDESDERAEFMSLLKQHFHAVVESCKEGVRKPDKAAFRIACEQLKTDPKEVGKQFLYIINTTFTTSRLRPKN